MRRLRREEGGLPYRLLLGQAARTPHVASAGPLPCASQLASHAAIDGKVDLPALKQTLHLVLQGMHCDAACDDCTVIIRIAAARRCRMSAPAIPKAMKRRGTEGVNVGNSAKPGVSACL